MSILERVYRISFVTLIAVVIAFACGEDEDQSSSLPTMDSYRAWITANHKTAYACHGCEGYADILNNISNKGAGVIPVGQERFFIVWLPDDWESRTNRKLVVTLHGNGACAERLFSWWYEYTSNRSWALAALQYGESCTGTSTNFDNGYAIYSNLSEMLSLLRANCPLTDIPVVYHGFSRGSARSVEIAILDKARGECGFAAYIADSGTWVAEGGQSEILSNCAADGMSGRHFWLYCGSNDNGGQTCTDMDQVFNFIQNKGGIIDDFVSCPTGGHGIFITGNPTVPGASLEAMYGYIDDIR